MPKDEIVMRYRQAADQKKQIAILAYLNMCSKAEIAEVLREAGESVSGNYGSRKIRTPEADMQQPETPEDGVVPVRSEDVAPESKIEKIRRAPERMVTPEMREAAKQRIIAEDMLDMVFSAVDAYMDAPAENEIGSEAVFFGYIIGLKDAYKAICGPIVR